MTDYNVEGRLITKDDWEKWLKSKEEESSKKESRYAVIEWHKYPQEKPKKDGFYLVTISDYVNYVVILRYSINDKWASVGFIESIDVIAWTELPIPFDREQHNVDVHWHPYPDEKPDEVRMYLTTEIFKKEKTVSMSLWLSPTNSFFHRDDEQILAWAKFPEPYKEEI